MCCITTALRMQQYHCEVVVICHCEVSFIKEQGVASECGIFCAGKEPEHACKADVEDAQLATNGAGH